MSLRRPYVVTVALRSYDSTRTRVLLSLVSTLHRRAAEVTQVSLSPTADGRYVFTAAFVATERRASTLRASLDNLVEVLDVSLDETSPDATDSTQSPHGRSRRSPVTVD